jgi:hypothetical protein
MKDARIDEVLFLDASILDQLRTEEVDPLAVGRVRYLAFVATVAAEQLSIRGYIEVDRPLVALRVVPGSFATSRR